MYADPDSFKMEKSKITRRHVVRIILALFLAQLIHIPVWAFGILGGSLLDALTTTDFHGHVKFYSSGLLFAGYAMLVSFVVTLVYGVPVYLVLHYFNKSNLLNLILAGLIMPMSIGLAFGNILGGLYAGIYGALVAAAFWMVVTPHGPRAVRYVIGATAALFVITLGLLFTTQILDKYYAEDIRTARLERALVKHAPLPVWWEATGNVDSFTSLEQARAVYRQYDRHNAASAEQKRRHREFFKAAYLTIQHASYDPTFLAELVLMMNLPGIDYPYITKLQEYALALHLPGTELRARILLAMLKTTESNPKAYDYPRSLSYDLITEKYTEMAPELLAPLCSRLAADYSGNRINYFEISVFRKCQARLSHFVDHPAIQQHLDIVNKQLAIMEKHLG